MKIKDFKQSAHTSKGDEVLTANDYYFELFNYDVFVIGNLSLKEGIVTDSRGQRAKMTMFFEGAKRISETQFENRIKNL